MKRWIVTDRCRLIALLGMGGIGKTALSVKLAQEIQGEFDCLIWRSLIEKQSGTYTQQPVVMEYVTERLIEQVCKEICELGIGNWELNVDNQITSTHYSLLTTPLFCSHALIKTTVKDYIRESQIRLILEPIASRLRASFSSEKALEHRLQEILRLRQSELSSSSDYGGGNLINLFCHLQIDLTGYDFSNLTLWHAYLQKINLHRVNFADSNFAKSVFTQTFSPIFTENNGFKAPPFNKVEGGFVL